MVIFSRNSETLVNRANTQSLTQLTQFTDNFLFAKIDDINREYFSKDSSQKDIAGFFNNMKDMTLADLKKVEEQIVGIKEQNSFIKSLVLYNEQYDSIVSTDDGVIAGATDPRNKLSINNQFFSYVSGITNDFYVPQDYNVNFLNPENSITYVHYVSTNEIAAFTRKNVNCVIMQIDTSYINDFVRTLDVDNMQSFFIYDTDGQILIHSDHFEESDWAYNKQNKLHQHIMLQSSGSEKIKLNGTNMTTVWVSSRLKDWKFIYTLSLDSFYRQLMFIILSVTLSAAFMIFIAYIAIGKITAHLYRPFEQAIKRLQNSLHHELHSDNELEMINDMIDDFSQKMNDYEDIMEKYDLFHNQSITYNMLYGSNLGSQEQIISDLKSSGIDFSKKYYGLILMEFNPILMNNMPKEEQNYIVKNITNMLYANFNCLIALTSSFTLEIIINYDSINYHAITNKMKQLIRQKSMFNLYCCDTSADINDIHPMHKKVYPLIQYSYIYGFDNIFDADILYRQNLDESVVDIKQINMIENILREGDKERFYEKCNEILNAVKSEKHSYKYAQNVIMHLFSIICRVAREHNTELYHQIEFEQIVKNTSFDNSTIYLFDISDHLLRDLSKKEDNSKLILIQNIRRYIDENITGDISLAGIAEHFNLSAGYLSKFFKENMPLPFAKYVINRKFEYAAKILTENKDISITELSNSLGYFDTAYFSKQFKAYYGITPVQYRRSHTN